MDRNIEMVEASLSMLESWKIHDHLKAIEHVLVTFFADWSFSYSAEIVHAFLQHWFAE